MRTGSLLAVGLTGLAGAAGWLGGEVLAPLAIALLVGLPHGAVDHLVLIRRLAGRRGWLVGLPLYAGVAAVTFLLADVLPLVVWGGFLLVSAWHFGTADRQYLASIGPQPSVLFALAAGVVPVGGLMVMDPDAIRPLATALHPMVSGLLDPGPVVTVAVGVSLLVTAALAVEVRAHRWHAVQDLGALVLVFLLAPSLWAFGIYFGLWHAVRHVTRMLTEEDPWVGVLRRQGGGTALLRFARDASAPTMTAGVAMVLGWWLSTGTDPVALTAVALKVTAAITIPHALTVGWLDRVRRTRAPAA